MRTFQPVLAALLLAPALGVIGSGCGEVADQLTADDVAIAALIKTPDQKKPNSTEVIPGIVTFQLFFGHIDKNKLVPKAGGAQDAIEGAFTANKDALVQLDFTDPVKGATTINVGKGATDGLYSATSSLDGRLAFVEGQYKLSISYSGKTYRMFATPGKPAGIKEFEGNSEHLIKDWEVAAHPEGFTLTRVGANDDLTKNDIAFVNLQNVTDATALPYSTMPADPLGFLKLILDDSAYRAKSFTIPQAEFKASNGYVVALTSLTKGEADPNAAKLFIGSTFLAGVADGGGIVTK